MNQNDASASSPAAPQGTGAERYVVVDTETTGLEAGDGDRIIEVGAVEVVGRRLGAEWRSYCNPEGRSSHPEALKVHGLQDDFLAGQPTFAQVREEFLDFIRGATLVIHNASFDLGFLDKELERCGKYPPLEQSNQILDTQVLARDLHPGMRNSLDSLIARYGISGDRTLHGALIDARFLAKVYLAMTGGQTGLQLGAEAGRQEGGGAEGGARVQSWPDTPSIQVGAEEERAHTEWMAKLREGAGEGGLVWDGSGQNASGQDAPGPDAPGPQE